MIPCAVNKYPRYSSFVLEELCFNRFTFIPILWSQANTFMTYRVVPREMAVTIGSWGMQNRRIWKVTLHFISEVLWCYEHSIWWLQVISFKRADKNHILTEQSTSKSVLNYRNNTSQVMMYVEEDYSTSLCLCLCWF